MCRKSQLIGLIVRLQKRYRLKKKINSFILPLNDNNDGDNNNNNNNNNVCHEGTAFDYNFKTIVISTMIITVPILNMNSSHHDR